MRLNVVASRIDFKDGHSYPNLGDTLAYSRPFSYDGKMVSLASVDVADIAPRPMRRLFMTWYTRKRHVIYCGIVNYTDVRDLKACVVCAH